MRKWFKRTLIGLGVVVLAVTVLVVFMAFNLWYQNIQQYALDPNLIDDDIFNAQENLHGIAAQASYNLTAAVNLQLTYAHGWWYNHNLGTGGNVGSLAIATNPTTEYNFFTADLNINF